jgi:hypothetical protein
MFEDQLGLAALRRIDAATAETVGSDSQRAGR